MRKVQKKLLFLVKEEGQALVLMVLFLSFIFLALAALAIDGTSIQLHRRQLQNMADASALAAAIALSQGTPITETYVIAMNTIEANGGRKEWYSDDGIRPAPDGNVYLSEEKKPEDLVKGIEITDGCDVRVALRWSDVGTYFAQFVGRERLQVGAKARAACNRAGGLMPIAVKRFGDQFDLEAAPGLNASGANPYCDECSTQVSLPSQGKGNAYDFLRPEGSDLITAWPAGYLIYESPSPHADLASNAPGRDYFILGNGTDPNVGTPSYIGLVNLDIRNIALSPEYYNGIDDGTNSNTLKELAEYYIRHGYCCDIPRPGDQIARYNGGSTSFATKAFQETYAINDVVAVIVYNGHVFSSPTLEMTVTPDYQATYPTTSTVASSSLAYSITLKAKDDFNSAVDGLSMYVEGLEGFADWSFSNNSPHLNVGGYGDTANVTLTITPKTTTVGTTTHVITGTRMFYIAAKDDKPTGQKIARYWAGIVTVGDAPDVIRPAVTALPTNSDRNYPYIVTVKGQQATYSMDLDLWGFTSDQNVRITPGSLPSGLEWAGNTPSGTPPSWNNNTRFNTHPGTSFNITIRATNSFSGSTTTPHVVPLTVSIPDRPDVAAQTFNLYVLVQESVPVVKDYVQVLGYAALQVMEYPNVNVVRGRIVSKLMIDPSELTYGLRARLIPWEQ